MGYQKITPAERAERSLHIRIQAAEKARSRPLVTHTDNGDESLPKKMMSFTKGLPHDYKTGLIKQEEDFEKFVEGICTGDPEIIKETPLGIQAKGKLRWKSSKGKKVNKIRAWESAGAGLTFDLQAPDAQAVTMPPAPALGSEALTAEMAEVYCQAVLRDIPFSEFSTNPKVKQCLDILNRFDYFKNGERNENLLTIDNIFRGFTYGDKVGPYISQFLLAGNNGLAASGSSLEFKANEGKINYGAITIDQRVRRAKAIDYMTSWPEFYDVQNGADFGGTEEYVGKERRFITSGRDLATYVHYDALYQAYLNACLLLLNAGAPFDPGVPFQIADEKDKQRGFAHYGGPHILTLVTEVATRALKAVRYQKFNVHRRLRPEALAARLYKKTAILKSVSNNPATKRLEKIYNELKKNKVFGLLDKNKLLPMAFAEGSPMHPTYGAGHATVAGACVTILKAFFEHGLSINIDESGETIGFSKKEGKYAFVPEKNGYSLLTTPTAQPLTVEGELNKLAANISIGRDWAGVHYYSDYKASLLMGEAIAIGLLEEQSIMYNPAENFSLTLPKFNGKIIKIPMHVS